jgi:hypothetical protein
MTDGYGDDDDFFSGFSALHLTLRPHTFHGWIYTFFFSYEGRIVTRSLYSYGLVT